MTLAQIQSETIYDRDTRVDQDFHVVGFAGGGGSSEAYRLAGHRVSVAMNHHGPALAMHTINHRYAEHYQEDIRRLDPRVICGGRRPRSAWFSPDCRDFSKAKGGKPKSKRVRGLAWVVLWWIATVRPEVIFLENVEEFLDWCPLLPNGKRSGWRRGWFFRCFVGALRRRGYTVDWQIQRARDYGAPTIRRRLFLVARCDGQPITWPKVTHGHPESDAVAAGLLKPWEMGAGCIDFRLPCPSVLMTRLQAKRLGLKVVRPLARASCRRIAVGVKRFVIDAAEPFIVALTHQGSDRVESLREPMRTITGANRGERALVAPFFAYNQQGGGMRDARAPLHTIAASDKDTNLLVTAHVVKMRGDNVGHPMAEPLHTISAAGQHHGVVATFLAQHNGGEKGNQSYGHPMTAPISTISGKGCQQAAVFAALCKYYGTEQAPDLRDPLHTVPTKDRFALAEVQGFIPPLTPELAKKARQIARWLRRNGVKVEGEFAMCGPYVIVDIGMRMLMPRELFRAQGFPEQYVIDRGLVVDKATGEVREIKLTRSQQVHMCGNSVSPLHAAAIIAANLN